MLLRVPHSSLRVWVRRLTPTLAAPKNGGSVALTIQQEHPDGTGLSWRAGVDSDVGVSALCDLSRLIAPDARGDWTVVAQYAYQDECDGRPPGFQGWFNRETGKPSVGALRVLYRRRWFDRLLGGEGEVRVQVGAYASGDEVSWYETSCLSETDADTRVPLPADNDVDIRIGTGPRVPPHDPKPMYPGYTKRVEPTTPNAAALWLLCLVWHGYMTRCGHPTCRFTPSPTEK